MYVSKTLFPVHSLYPAYTLQTSLISRKLYHYLCLSAHLHLLSQIIYFQNRHLSAQLSLISAANSAPARTSIFALIFLFILLLHSCPIGTSFKIFLQLFYYTIYSNLFLYFFYKLPCTNMNIFGMFCIFWVVHNFST